MVTIGGRGFQILRIVLCAFQTDLDIGLGNTLHRVAEFLGDQFSGVGIDDVIAAQHLALLDHELHNVSDAFVHPSGQVLQRDGFGQGHLDGNLFPVIVATTPALAFTFTGPAHRRQRPLTVGIVAKRGRDGQLATAAGVATTSTTGRRIIARTVIAVIPAALAALATAAGALIRCRRCPARSRLEVGLGTGRRGFARPFSTFLLSRFSGLAGFFLSLAAGFSLFAFFLFLKLALLFGPEALLGRLVFLDLFGARVLLVLLFGQRFLLRDQFRDRDAALGRNGLQLLLERRFALAGSGRRGVAGPFRSARTNRPALLRLHDDLFGPAMAEALLHRTRCLAGNSERLAPARIATSVFRIAHSSYISQFWPTHPHGAKAVCPLPILIRKPVQLRPLPKPGKARIRGLQSFGERPLADETVYHTLTSECHAQFSRCQGTRNFHPAI